MLVRFGLYAALPVDGHDAFLITDIGELLGYCGPGIRIRILPCSRISLESDLIIRGLILIHRVSRDDRIFCLRRNTALDDIFLIGHSHFLL